MHIAVQLYTLRKVIQHDVPIGFKTLQKLGFQYVELAGFYGLEIKTFKQLLDTYGLTPISSHVSLHDLEHHFDDVVDHHKLLNVKHIIIPYTDMKDQQSFLSFLPRIKSAVKKLQAQGFITHYHNHANEFESFDGQYIIEHLLREVDGLYLEFDVYWAKYAEIDIDAFIQHHHSKILCLHAKDYQLDDNQKPYFESVGSGVIDFKKLINHLPALNYVIIENDLPKNDPFENVLTSLDYLKKII